MRSILSAAFTLLFVSLFAQAPQGIKYQAVARDVNGTLYDNEQIAVRFSIIDSTDSGPVIYSERQVLNTSNLGLFTASLGQGVVLSGTFASINWGAAPKYIKVEFDPAGGTNYFDMGTSQLLSVPYALYAQTSGGGGGGSDSQTLSINGDQLSISNGNTVTLPTGGGGSYTAGTGIDLTGNVITNTAPDQTVAIIGTGTTVVSGTYPSFTVNTPAQTLSLAGDVLSISNGNSVTLPSGGGGSYVAGTGIDITGTTITNTDPDQVVSITGTGITTVSGTYPNFVVNSSEVPQVLDINGNTLSLSNGGGSVTIPVGADNDPTNELQQLSINGSQLTLSNGNTVSLPSGGVPDADSDSTNELNTGAVLNGNTLEITDAGGTVSVDLSALGNDADSDPTNELNTNLVFNSNTSVLSLTDAGSTLTVDLSSLAGGGPDADSDSTNELNTAFTYNAASNVLSLTDAGATLSVDLSDLDGGSSGDTDSTNELQSLSSSVNAGTVTVNITDGTGTSFSIDDADSNPTNEIQTLSLSGNGDTLKLSNGGGSVLLPSGSGGTLDEAYDFGGAGAGRIITADAGPLEVNTASNSAAGIKVTHSGTGVAIQALSTNPANGFSTIQAETNSTQANTAGIIGSSTGASYAIAGQLQTTATAFSAIYGSNLRTSGGAGVEGEGFNGTSGRGLNVQGFGVFGENLAAANGTRTNQLYAVGVGSIGFVGTLGQTDQTDGAGVMGLNVGTGGSIAIRNPGVEGRGFTGVLGTSNSVGVGFGVLSSDDLGASNDVIAGGDLIAGGFKPFRIDYPLDPANKFLFHYAIESNEVLNMYRGTIQLDANGEAVVELPVYFQSVNKNFSYQLTSIGVSSPGLFVKTEIQDRTFVIAGGKPGQKVSWQVTAERNDPYAANHPEAKRDIQEKAPHQVGQYVHPAEYGKAETDGMMYVKPSAITTLQKPEGRKSNEQIKLK